MRAAIDDAIAPHGGRVFNTAGDGFMIEFSSPLSGVAARAGVARRRSRERACRAMRIGLHLGDVILGETTTC